TFAPPAPLSPVVAPMSAPVALQPPAPIRLKSEPSAPVRLKSDAPIGFAPPKRPSKPEPSIYETRLAPPSGRDAQNEKSSFPWKLAAAVIIVMAIGVTAGRAYLPSARSSSADEVAPPAKVPAVPAPVAASPAKGSIVVETQPAGAHILLDGK